MCLEKIDPEFLRFSKLPACNALF